MLLIKLRMLLHQGAVPLPGWFLNAPGADFLLFVVPFAISVLGFETLVWLGVRQVRYANAAP